MPKMKRDEKTGALIFEYDESELRENVGWRLMKLEEKVRELEEKVRELSKEVEKLKKKVER
jgi:chaperonin cofactor prefoldin